MVVLGHLGDSTDQGGAMVLKVVDNVVASMGRGKNLRIAVVTFLPKVGLLKVMKW